MEGLDTGRVETTVMSTPNIWEIIKNLFQELQQRDEKRECEQRNLVQRITRLEGKNEEHEETAADLRKRIANLGARVNNPQQTFGQQQTVNIGFEKREAQLEEDKLETAATESMVGARENSHPLPISSLERNRQRRATDKSTSYTSETSRQRRATGKSASNSSEGISTTTAPTSVAGSHVGENTDSLPNGSTPTNPVGPSIKMPQRPDEDQHKKAVVPVSKNTSPTTPRSPIKPFIPNVELEQAGRLRKRTNSFISPSCQSTASSPESSPSLFVSPENVLKHSNSRKIRPSSRATDQAVEVTSKLNRMISRGTALRSTPENEQRNKRKRRKTYTSPKFGESSPENSSEEVHKRPGWHWTEKDIGDKSVDLKALADSKLQASGLHQKIITKIHEADSSVRNPQHRYKSMSKIIGTNSALCWLSQNYPLKGFEEVRPIRPGGDRMCGQCEERKRRNQLVNCFYFIKKDHIVVYE